MRLPLGVAEEGAFPNRSVRADGPTAYAGVREVEAGYLSTNFEKSSKGTKKLADPSIAEDTENQCNGVGESKLS